PEHPFQGVQEHLVRLRVGGHLGPRGLTRPPAGGDQPRHPEARPKPGRLRHRGPPGGVADPREARPGAEEGPSGGAKGLPFLRSAGTTIQEPPSGSLTIVKKRSSLATRIMSETTDVGLRSTSLPPDCSSRLCSWMSRPNPYPPTESSSPRS